MPYKYKRSPKLNKKKTGLYDATKASRRTSTREYFTKKRMFKIKLVVLLLFIILVLMGCVYFAFFTPFLHISQLEIEFDNGPYLISENEVKNIVYAHMNEQYLYFLSRNNLILFSSNRLKDIAKKDSRIDLITVKKNWLPRKLYIKIKESDIVARLVIIGDNNEYYINRRGQTIIPPEGRGDDISEDITISEKQQRSDVKDLTIIEESSDDKDFTTHNKIKRIVITDLPLFYDQTSTSLNDPLITQLFKDVLDFIKANILIVNNVDINQIKINKEGGVFNIEMTTPEGWQIFINSEADFDKQLHTLTLVLEEKLKNREALQYIDLRFGEKIFYKLSE